MEWTASGVSGPMGHSMLTGTKMAEVLRCAGTASPGKQLIEHHSEAG